MICSVFKDEKLIASKVTLANSFWSRLVGLLSKRKQDDNAGLLLMPCAQVHTYFMKFPIDAVFLSDTNVVLHIENLMPGKISRNVVDCKKVLELNWGVAGAYELRPGVQLRVIQADKETVQRKENIHVKG